MSTLAKRQERFRKGCAPARARRCPPCDCLAPRVAPVGPDLVARDQHPLLLAHASEVAELLGRPCAASAGWRNHLARCSAESLARNCGGAHVPRSRWPSEANCQSTVINDDRSNAPGALACDQRSRTTCLERNAEETRKASDLLQEGRGQDLLRGLAMRHATT